jgi:ubiquinone/menaquinone biosynthesis C-methylase UbiE
MEPFKNIIRIENDIHFLSKTDDPDHFEKDYLEVRKKEGRVFSDEMIKMLPLLPGSHPLYKEWRHRAATQKMFCKYLSSANGLPVILDLGCGNGWFSKKMKSALPDAYIFAMDINLHELKQAARLFNQEIRLLYGDIFQDLFKPGSFDIIVLNSSIQYFNDVNKLLNRLLKLLTKQGKIHILDSPIYHTETEQQEAKKRTIKYFSDMQVKNMAKHYNHHTFKSLEDFNFEMLYDPKSTSKRLARIFGRNISLFPWIMIHNS